MSTNEPRLGLQGSLLSGSPLHLKDHLLVSPLSCYFLILAGKNWHQLSIIMLSAKQCGFYFMMGMSGKYPSHSCCSRDCLYLLCVSNAFVLVSESSEANYSFNTKLPESWTHDVSKLFILFKGIYWNLIKQWALFIFFIFDSCEVHLQTTRMFLFSLFFKGTYLQVKTAS